MADIHPKEKMRLAERRKNVMSLTGEARSRYLRSLGMLDQQHDKRCRSAIGLNRVLIVMTNRIYEYLPSTGEVIWAASNFEKNVMGTDALYWQTNNYPVLRDAFNNYVSATRLIYEAVHGEIPEGHDVYCVNNDPKDLRVYNLRTHHDGGRKEAIKSMKEWNKAMRELSGG